MRRRRNDILWKGILEEVFEDFLRFTFPHADQIFDMKKGFTFLDKELSEMYPEPDKETSTRFVDKLVKVFMQDGKEKYLLVHVEVQGQYDPEFPKRMFRYFYRIFDRYDLPVVPVAIFTGKDGKRMPDRYELIHEGLELTYKFNTLYITDYKDDELMGSNNPFALVLLAAKNSTFTGKDSDQKLLEHKRLVLNLLYEKRISKHKIKVILSFLNNYVLFAKKETNRIFEKELDHITGKKNTMGILEQLAEIRAKEGEEKGRREEQMKSVKAFLANTEFSPQKIASLLEVPVSFVEKVKKRLMVKSN
jgi:predicted transposase YdaD